MPKGPNGEKRPANAIGLAVLVGRIAIGEVDDVPVDDGKDPAAKALGKKGGAARAASMAAEERAKAARKAAAAR
ncbi:RNA-binding protein [Pseudogemmobacter blasticus]|uniref:RNA-binding protein n=1 Tax=Fuscovulum blasticum DSM 2131 TaxID=1188250 RepID=A0A2T4J5E2_FUSBL|nr:RNA-binding protein [Fuscovulum blasticum]PTE13085.1 RNA-binding protein [Fuscovulum blasticum DSM 2131]